MHEEPEKQTSRAHPTDRAYCRRIPQVRHKVTDLSTGSATCADAGPAQLIHFLSANTIIKETFIVRESKAQVPLIPSLHQLLICRPSSPGA
jgi:hypothetical protein